MFKNFEIVSETSKQYTIKLNGLTCTVTKELIKDLEKVHKFDIEQELYNILSAKSSRNN